MGEMCSNQGDIRDGYNILIRKPEEETTREIDTD